MKMVGVFSKNTANWMIVDLACIMSGITTVTLYDTLGEDSTQYIIN